MSMLTLMSALALCWPSLIGYAAAKVPPSCPGKFEMAGFGEVDLVPTGWADKVTVPVNVSEGGELIPHIDGRAYFASRCTAGKYDHKQYLALNLLGKLLSYTVDLSGAGCGCNAAFYLTSMRQNTKPSECSDYYCDANNVCGESCAEIDIQEANQFSWHTTLHTATDHNGVSGGFGGGDSWTGPRDWGASEYGKGARCVDTSKPFQVKAGFPVDSSGSLAGLQMTLSQGGKPCNLSVVLSSYDGMRELSTALEAGMTPVVSYWSDDDMLWMDGPGADGQGPCEKDDASACGKTVKFYDFSLENISSRDAGPAARNGPDSKTSSASKSSTSKPSASKPSASTSSASRPSASRSSTSKASTSKSSISELRTSLAATSASTSAAPAASATSTPATTTTAPTTAAALDALTPKISSSAPAAGEPVCPGDFEVTGYGSVHIVPTGWMGSDEFKPVKVSKAGKLTATMGSRAYFARNCTAGSYDHKQYVAVDLLGKSLSYSVDLSGAGCGCNAAFYLTSMAQNKNPSDCSDFYCDANNVCGESCAEIDIQEANMFAWHSTLHSAADRSGSGGGYGGGDSWNGPRDWGSAEYGKGAKCVDTNKPFHVMASFPVDGQGVLAAMEVTLYQHGKTCNVSTRTDGYPGMQELTDALTAGMTPILSYWSASDMLWMDGAGSDGQGPCQVDDVDACGESVHFYDFSISEIAAAPHTKSKAVVVVNDGIDRSHCGQAYTTNCASVQCCQSPGMQCYVKDEWWATCKETCVPGSTDNRDPEWARSPWSCQALGPRTPRAAGSANKSHSGKKDRRATKGRVVVKVRADEPLPHLHDGSEVTVLLGDKEVQAEVTFTGAALRYAPKIAE